jgi:dTDP-4-amino-4,6-dideoxygalactose transaminase
MIPFLDLRQQHVSLLPELLGAVESALRAGAFIGGPEVEGFEQEFASFCGVPYCAGVGSGTDALRFAFLALGVRSGDEVITVPQTFIATAEAISQAGGSVRFVDIDPQTHTMDPAALEAAITPRTVGVVPVHLYGRPADMDAIMAIADQHGVWVVEDAAQAHGAKYKGRAVGSIGTAGCFSFYPGKNLGACGEAGAVVSRDATLIEQVKVIRDHGQARKYVHRLEGYNGRLDAIQAAILRVKLRRVAEWVERRRAVALWYGELLDGLPGIDPPLEPEYAWSVFHLYAIQAEDRDGLRAQLSAAGIGVGMHYPVPLHLQQAYAGRGWGPGSFPAAETVAAHTLSLPMYPELSRQLVEAVAAAVTEHSRTFGIAPA